MPMLKLSSALLQICRFVAGVLLLVIIFGSIHVNVQQSIRTGANDPQIELAQQAATFLAKDIDPIELIPDSAPQVDIAKQLAPFIIIYGDDGKAIAGNGKLDDELPTPPSGVFDAARTNGEHRVSWEPKPGVRVAIQVLRVETAKQPYFILAGRSLREIENREHASLFHAAAGFAAALVVYAAWTLIGLKKAKEEHHTHTHVA
jgi:hypothetical protein